MPSIQASLLKDVAQSGSQLKSKGSLILTGDGNERPLPLSLLMVLDVSGSMRGSGITVVTESVVHVLNNLLGPEDKIAVITFNGSANVHTPWIDVSGNVPRSLQEEAQTSGPPSIQFLTSSALMMPAATARAWSCSFQTDMQGSPRMTMWPPSQNSVSPCIPLG